MLKKNKTDSEDLYRIKDRFSKIKKVTNLDRDILSFAAKTHFILKSLQCPPKTQDIKNTAKELGWSLSKNQVQKAIELLEYLLN